LDYVALAVTITDQESNMKKILHEKDVRFSIEYNERFATHKLFFETIYVTMIALNPKSEISTNTVNISEV
jgi:hypothetical protein